MFPDFKIGVGTWAWGDHLVWNYGSDYDENSLFDAFSQSIRDGIQFFCTSETFSDGRTEQLLGNFIQKSSQKTFVATKFVPGFWRLGRNDFMKALKASLTRLHIPAIDLYLIFPPAGMMRLPMLAECMSDAFESGLIRYAGVSNFSAIQIEQFYGHLNRFGIPLSCIETEYNLLHRDIETNGVLEICRQLSIQIIAQSPLAMGALTGKYLSQNELIGIRRKFMEKYMSQNLPVLIRLMNHIGSEHGGMNSAQVSLNWLIRKNVIPIPGAKNANQAMQNNQAAGWTLTAEQEAQLDDLSATISKLRGD